MAYYKFLGRADFEKNAIGTISAQSPLKHLVIHFGCLLAFVLSKCCIERFFGFPDSTFVKLCIAPRHGGTCCEVSIPVSLWNGVASHQKILVGGGKGVYSLCFLIKRITQTGKKKQTKQNKQSEV